MSSEERTNSGLWDPPDLTKLTEKGSCGEALDARASKGLDRGETGMLKRLEDICRFIVSTLW